MRPRRSPPTTTAELLADLRAARLLSSATAQQLAAEWGEGDPAVRARELVAAGRLTSYQAEQVLAGQARCLRLGPYHLLARLGAGGMSQVFKAEHRLMKRVVALKIIGRVRRRKAKGAPKGASSAAVAVPRTTGSRLAEFRREVQAAAQLAHPNIVTAFDAGHARGKLFLVMEHVEGIDLARLLAEEGPVAWPVACEMVRQVACALECVRQRGLVHRDVKPGNVLLDRAAPYLTVKLLDLGLARRAAEDGKKDLCGTTDYMAPERGEAAPDIRADLYSLGCTFYHLLTGQVPYPGGPWPSKLLRHRLDSPPPVRQFCPDVPVEVAAVVERLMARAPQNRYQAPSEVGSALTDLLAHGGRPAPSQPTRRRAPFPGVGAMLSAILVGLMLGWAARATLALSASREGPTTSAPVSAPVRIVVEGHSGGFATLAEAVDAATDGGVLTLHGNGRCLVPPLSWSGKALTLRAAPGARPCLERDEKGGPGWEALLCSDRDLTLEGLELRAPSSAEPWPLVCVEGARLRLKDCVLRSRSGPLVALRLGAELVLVGCQLEGSQGVSVQVGQRPCRVRLEKCALRLRGADGPALTLWSSEEHEPAALEVSLERCSCSAGRVIACRGLRGPATLRARDNEFAFRTALFSFAGYAGEDDWRRRTTWEGQGNRYQSGGGWLRVEGRTMAQAMRFER